MEKTEIIRLYVEDKLSIADISNMAPQSKSTIRRILYKAGKLRSVLEANRLAIHKIGRKRRGPHGPLTDEQRENMRKSAKKRWEGKSRGISLKPNGYYEITTGENKGRLLHDVIMETLIGRRLRNNEVVHHRDKVRSNNDIANLELMTTSEHSRLHNLEQFRNESRYDISKHTKRGSESTSSKITEENVREILISDLPTKHFCKKLNVTRATVNKIRSGKAWKHITI